MPRLPWIHCLVAVLGGTMIRLCQGTLRFDATALRINPIKRVVGLLEDMENQIEVDAKKDEEAYEKMVCWCTGTKKAKSLAIEKGAARIDQLSSEIDQATALSARLGPELEALQNEVERNNKALEQAAAIREKQAKEYEAESADIEGSLAALKQALKSINDKGRSTSAGESMLQVSSQSVTSILQQALAQRPKLLNSILQKARATKHSHQQDLKGGQPALDPETVNVTQKRGSAGTEEVEGTINDMLNTFQKNLQEMGGEEEKNQYAYAKLQKAKQEELKTGKAQILVKGKEKAATDEQLAYDKKDKKTAIANWNSDKVFLASVNERCAKNELHWDRRQKERREEVEAVNQAVNVLTGSRDSTATAAASLDVDASAPAAATEELDASAPAAATEELDAIAPAAYPAASPASSPSFLQKSQLRRSGREQAAHVLASLASRRNDGRLSALALRVRIDSMTEVRKAIDGMIAELKQQKAGELQKKDFCTAKLHENQMQQDKAERRKEDVELLLEHLAERTKKASGEKKELGGEIADMKKELMKAAEEREDQNKAFQLSVRDQRETQGLLRGALKVLKGYYASESAFVQESYGTSKVSEGEGSDGTVAPAPRGIDPYEKSSGATGVMALLEFILEQSRSAENDAIKDESESQSDYEGTVSDSTESIGKKDKEVENKNVALAKFEESTVDASTDRTNILESKEGLLKAAGTLHRDCDFLLKNFELRQKAFDDETSALIEAQGLMTGISGAPLSSSPAAAPS